MDIKNKVYIFEHAFKRARTCYEGKDPTRFSAGYLNLGKTGFDLTFYGSLHNSDWKINFYRSKDLKGKFWAYSPIDTNKVNVADVMSELPEELAEIIAVNIYLFS